MHTRFVIFQMVNGDDDDAKMPINYLYNQMERADGEGRQWNDVGSVVRTKWIAKNIKLISQGLPIVDFNWKQSPLC